MNHLHLKLGDYALTLYLDKLCDLPAGNFRKVLALIRAASPDEAAAAAAVLYAYLTSAQDTALAAWKQASRDYAAGWERVTNTRSRRPETIAVLQKNRRLHNAVKRTKALYGRMTAMLNTYVAVIGRKGN